MNIQIEEKDIIDYKRRRYKSIKSISIICFIILLLMIRSENFPYAVLIVGAIVIINYYRSINSDTYLLTHLKIEDERLYISYFKKDEKIEIEGDVYAFSVYKRYDVLSRNPTAYLYIAHNNISVLKQYQNATWDSNKMDVIVEYFRKYST